MHESTRGEESREEIFEVFFVFASYRHQVNSGLTISFAIAGLQKERSNPCRSFQNGSKV